MQFVSMNVILLYSFGHSCGHLQGGKCKNTNMFIVCQCHPTVKIIQICLKFRLNGKTVMSIKY
jgi:hypothetical protein